MPGQPPKIGTPPGINHGYTVSRPGDGARRDIPCTCALVELTVQLPAYRIRALEAFAAHENTTVQEVAAGRLDGFSNAYPLNQDSACQDPCKHTP